jgi:hypothetical protein
MPNKNSEEGVTSPEEKRLFEVQIIIAFVAVGAGSIFQHEYLSDLTILVRTATQSKLRLQILVV